MSSGYTGCACRDCMETVVSNDMARPDYCDDCSDAGCPDSLSGECQVELDLDNTEWASGD